MPDPSRTVQLCEQASELQAMRWPRNVGCREYDGTKERGDLKRLESSVMQADKDIRLNAPWTQKKARVKRSSKYFGVRFRPDLHKWVAEIRVAEWKLVDRKVWLGTFDTEQDAGRAVDVARMLLKCRKSRPLNFPCLNLKDYVEPLPTHLNLNHLENEAMFKEVTLFVKRKAREYATSLYTCELCNDVSFAPSHPVEIVGFDSHPSPSFHSEQESSSDLQTMFLASWEDEVNLPSCHHSNLPCEAPPTCSVSEGEEMDWIPLNQHSYSFDAPIPFQSDAQWFAECEMTSAKTQSLREDQEFFFPDVFGDELSIDNGFVGSEICIPSDDQAYCMQEPTSMDMVSNDEIPLDNCWTHPDISSRRTAFSALDTNLLTTIPLFYNSLGMSSIDGPLVC